jgi:hypothetical protein
MRPALSEIYDSATKLPFDMQSILVEKLICNVESHIDPQLEQQHIRIAKRRRDEHRSGKAPSVDGDSALQRVRQVVMK